MGSARFHWVHDLGKYHADAYIQCRCGHAVTLTLKQLGIQLYLLRWQELEARLRCSQCGKRGQRVAPVPIRREPLTK